MNEVSRLLWISLCVIFPLYGWKAVSMDFHNKIGIFTSIAQDTDVIVWAVDQQFTAADFIKQGYTPVRFVVKNMNDESVLISSKSLMSDRSFDLSNWNAQIKYHEIWRPLAWCMLRGIPLFAIAGAATLQAKQEDINKKAAQARGDAYFSSKNTYTEVAVYGWALTVLNLVFLTPYHWFKIKEANIRMSNELNEVFCLNPTVVLPSKEVTKVYLIPHMPSKPIEFAVFNEKEDGVAAQFEIDYQKLK